jgi:hypothetical protein
MSSKAGKPGKYTRPEADEALADRYVEARRVCLRCRQEFDSSWSGHRLCPTCTAYAADH